MKTRLLISLSLIVAALCGCSTSKPVLTPSMLQSGVQAAVSFGVVKYPSALPYVKAAEPIICSAAESTNLVPAEVVRAIQEAGVLTTPESVFIVNSALLLYEGVYNAYGSDAVNNSPMLQSYLHAVCLGIGDGLPPEAVASRLSPTRLRWPMVK